MYCDVPSHPPMEMANKKLCDEVRDLRLQVRELKEWIWNQGHIRVASHRAEDCARCKLEEKRGR